MSALNFNQMIIDAVDAVLETMFFAAPMGPSPEPQEDSIPVLQARVEFTGKPSGNLRVSLCASSARLLAANFLGEDENTLTDGQIEQVVCELTNMLCGGVASQLESNQPFDLAPPELLPACCPHRCQAAPVATAQQSFALENGFLTVTLCVEPA